jgi:hypothetical protein
VPVSERRRLALPGSGYKQLTGRANYGSIGAIISMDLGGQPELARDRRLLPAPLSPSGMRASAHRWPITAMWMRSPSGSTAPTKLGLAERREATERAMDILL